jgi:hypothetical protein
MSSPESPISQAHSQPQARIRVASVVPPAAGEAAASSVLWERRGLLQRLARAN